MKNHNDPNTFSPTKSLNSVSSDNTEENISTKEKAKTSSLFLNKIISILNDAALSIEQTLEQSNEIQNQVAKESLRIIDSYESSIHAIDLELDRLVYSYEASQKKPKSTISSIFENDYSYYDSQIDDNDGFVVKHSEQQNMEAPVSHALNFHLQNLDDDECDSLFSIPLESEKADLYSGRKERRNSVSNKGKRRSNFSGQVSKPDSDRFSSVKKRTPSPSSSRSKQSADPKKKKEEMHRKKHETRSEILSDMAKMYAVGSDLEESFKLATSKKKRKYLHSVWNRHKAQSGNALVRMIHRYKPSSSSSSSITTTTSSDLKGKQNYNRDGNESLASGKRGLSHDVKRMFQDIESMRSEFLKEVDDSLGDIIL